MAHSLFSGAAGSVPEGLRGFKMERVRALSRIGSLKTAFGDGMYDWKKQEEPKLRQEPREESSGPSHSCKQGHRGIGALGGGRRRSSAVGGSQGGIENHHIGREKPRRQKPAPIQHPPAWPLRARLSYHSMPRGRLRHCTKQAVMGSRRHRAASCIGCRATSVLRTTGRHSMRASWQSGSRSHSLSSSTLCRGFSRRLCGSLAFSSAACARWSRTCAPATCRSIC